MNEEKEILLIRRNELQRRSIVDEKLTIGGVYHLLKELEEVNKNIARWSLPNTEENLGGKSG